MVGGFSLSPAAPFYPSFLTRIHQVSLAVALAMLLLHVALILPAAAAMPGSIPKSKYRLTLGYDKHLQLPRPQLTTTISSTQRLHRHMLVSGGAIRSSQNEDQAARALVGSSPPKCVKKCGACTPCKSVLVPIHTNNLPATPTEYYPEAWRCQCKGKIYNP